MSRQTIVDTIIQGAVVNLFHSLNVAVAPTEPTSGRPLLDFPELAAFVQFNATAGSGVLCLGCPLGVVDLAAGAVSGAVSKEDWIREFINQLMGRVKKRFLQFGVNMTVTLPSAATKQFIGQHVGRAAPASRLFTFRTMRGAVMLLLDANINESELAYCGAVQIRDEGDIILF